MIRPSLLLCLGFLALATHAQQDDRWVDRVLTPADTFRPDRFWPLASAGATGYTGTVLALNKLWYSQYPRGNFQTFDDWEEWRGMDKMGHLITSYTEAKWVYQASRWTGVPKKQAILLGMGSSLLFQTTLEVMDGFSAEWGFSWYDVAFNLGGTALFGVQEFLGKGQLIIPKVSTHYRRYSDAPLLSADGTVSSSLKERTDELFGDRFSQTFFKDYNALTMWTSVNLHVLLPAGNRIPPWLNLAVGISAENVFGARHNTWENEGNLYTLNRTEFPRYSQVILSPDLDLSKIQVRSRLLRTLLTTFNFIKIPAPALEVNSLGKFRFHFFYF